MLSKSNLNYMLNEGQVKGDGSVVDQSVTCSARKTREDWSEDWRYNYKGVMP